MVIVSGRGRAPMTPQLRESLQLQVIGKRPDDFVATGENGGMIGHQFLRRSLQRLCKLAGVKSITPHELRHSCTELFVEAGASQEDLRRLLNHRSAQSTAGYMHRTDRRLNGIAAQVQSPGNQTEKMQSTVASELVSPLILH